MASNGEDQGPVAEVPTKAMFEIGPPRTEAIENGEEEGVKVEATSAETGSADDGDEGGHPFCRLCFTKSDDLCPLFPPATIPNKTLLHKIFDCTTITLSFRDDHNAQICTGCVVNIEAFFKYKITCVENDRLLRKRRTSFFSGLGLTADSGKLEVSGMVDDDDDDDEEKQLVKELEKEEGQDEVKTKGGSEVEGCTVKQELMDEEEDDDDGYFNPEQFLSQDTQIGEKSIDQASLNGSGYDSGTSGIERGWKTTDFSPQPGVSGLKPLKITDYSNLTGKRGRPQKFITTVPTERLLARPVGPNPYSNHPQSQHPFQTSSPLQRPQQQQPQRGFESAYRQHLGLTNGNGVGGGGGRPTMSPAMPMSANRYEPYPAALPPMSTAVEQTRKVQKFLDDGLRDLILCQGTPNPNFALDGGYTSFKVVKARCNSYNLIFEANRFLRRNKSCSGLPKWYWACSINGCPVKVCSYRGRLFKTNDKINHIHPPSETDESHHEVVLPHQIDADMSLLQQQQQQQQQIPMAPSQSQIHRQLQQQLQQRQMMKSAAAMTASAAMPARDPLSSSLVEDSSCSNLEEEVYEDASSYEMVKGEEQKDAVLIYKNLKYQLEKVEEDGVKVWKCASVKSEGSGENVSETIRQLVDGRIKLEKKTKKQVSSEEEEEDDDYGPYDDDAEGGKRKNSRPPKIAIYEGYHYKYCHARPEGTYYWRCLLKSDESVNCPASLHTKATFEFLNFNDQTHNHDPPDDSVKLENAIVCKIKPSQKPPVVPPVGSTDFQLVKSGQKREFLIYQGYRYYFQYESKNGKRSYRCTMFRNCPAGAFLMPDNTIAEAKNFVHTHPPTENLEKYVTKDSLITSPIKDVDGQPRRQQQTLAQSGAFPMISEQPDPRPAGTSEEIARANGYKIILNYKNKEILIYNGWRYFVDYKKKNGGAVWRCSSHRLCRGAVHLFPDGSINFAKLVDHNHMPPRRNLTAGSLSLDSGSRPTDITFDGSFPGSTGMLPDNAYAPPSHRFILHHGHRFRFATRKREGTIYWRCAMRLDTKCPVSFHTKEDTYELVSMRNHDHNHGIPTVWPEYAGGVLEEELPVVKMPQEEIGTMDYILTKNSKGRDVILYQNGRYYLDYSRKDGKVVFRCSAVAGCRAMVLLLPNKTLQVSRELIHNHATMPPLGHPQIQQQQQQHQQQQHHQMMMQQQHLQRQRLQQQQLHNMSASQQHQQQQMHMSSMSMDTSAEATVEIKSDDECQLVAPPDPLGMDQSAEPAAPTTTTSTSSMLSTSAGLQCPNFIVHLGYHYKFISKSEEDRTAYWRCSNFEAKMNCQAAIYTTLGGQVLRNNNMMHNHKAEDYANATANNSLAKRKNMIGSRDYKIVKNWKNRDVLVFQQCRYFLHYVRKDGRKVWRCSAIRSCHAAVYLGADGRVDQVKGEHVHDIRQEGEPRRRRRIGGGMMMPGGGNGMSPMSGPPGNGNGSAEWIDYSDYGFQMNPSDSNSLWDNFNPHQLGGPAASTPGAPTGNGDNFDLSYHSVFGGQSAGFENSNYGMASQQNMTANDNSVMDEDDDDDDDEGLPLEPDVSFAEHEDNFDELHLEPIVQMADD